MAKWFFREHDGFSDINQSPSAEAFEGKAVRNLATCVVRESIQNVLDVQLDKKSPARVRFTIGVLPNEDMVHSPWFDGLMDHLQHKDAGIPHPPKISESCPYLLIEDFNTTGLVGDYAAPYIPGTENNFVNFLYHDGLTGKTDKKLGSRGVGKIVLLLASRARTFFAYTIRDGDSTHGPLLVGKTLLKFRQVEGQLYEPAGYFLAAWQQQSAREPVTNPALLSRFRRDFSPARINETGLSIVIPFLDPNISMQDIRSAVIEEYYFAILSNKLVVELANGKAVEKIHSGYIPDLEDYELSARVALAQYAISNPNPSLETIAPAADGTQKLSEELIPSDVRTAILKALNMHERIAVRCNLHIHPRNGPPVQTFCDVYLEHADKGTHRPAFIRELLPISGEGRPCPQLRALVVICPGPLADLLRAAEGANHTQWSTRTDNFTKAYKGRLGEIDFVSSIVNRLIEIARGNATEPVGGISTLYFSVPSDLNGPNSGKGRKVGKGRKSNKGERGPNPEEPTPPDDPSNFIGYQCNEHPGGFVIKSHPDKKPPKRIIVRVAYDVIRGSPWSDYDPDDFDFRDLNGDVSVEVSGATVKRADPGNRLVIEPSADDFYLRVGGFNDFLDLIIDHVAYIPKVRKGKE